MVMLLDEFIHFCHKLSLLFIKVDELRSLY
jgi:hypothetical protein